MANNFNPGFDREKATFIELVNRGDGLTPVNYLYAKEASFESILSPTINSGTGEFYTIYSNGINSSTINNSEDIVTNRLKWTNQFNDYYVGFTAGNLTQSTIWRLPLQDGTDGQVLTTNGSGILSFRDVKGTAPDDATYILQQPNTALPNAQALSQLNNGLMKNNSGVVEIAVAGKDYLTPDLPSGQLLVGNSSNIATAQQTITIDNLPNLGTESINIPNPLDPSNPIVISGSKIWEGSAANRPVESDSLLIVKGDITLINFRFLTANFILGSGNAVLQTLMPGSQFLSNLPSGSWMQTSGTGNGTIVAATIEQNQLLMGGVNNIPESRQTIDITNLPSLTEGMVWQGDSTNRPVETELNIAPTDGTYIIQTPNADLPQAQVLNTLGTGITKLIANGVFAIAVAGEDYATPQQLDGIKQQCQTYANQASTSAGEAAASATGATGAAAEATGAAAEASGSAIAAGLSATGAAAAAISAASSAHDASSSANNAQQSSNNAAGSANQAQNYLNTLLNTIAPTNGTYIIQTPNASLSEAQVLSELGIGMAKIIEGGAFAIAIPNVDYATTQQLDGIQQQCQTSAGAATLSATEATGAATNAKQSAIDAKTYLDNLLATGITLQGDVNGSGLLTTVFTMTFKPNPRFTGNESLTMPSGKTSERPTTLIPGMIRFNTEL